MIISRRRRLLESAVIAAATNALSALPALAQDAAYPSRPVKVIVPFGAGGTADLEARVVGTTKPFRVRVGRYATRSEAEQASRDVDKVAKSRSIVVIVGPEER